MAPATALCALLLIPVGILPQSPGPIGWNDLIDKSTVIVVGVVERILDVSREASGPPASKRLPNGNVITDLPNVQDTRVGRAVAVHVVEVIKKKGASKPVALFSCLSLLARPKARRS